MELKKFFGRGWSAVAGLLAVILLAGCYSVDPLDPLGVGKTNTAGAGQWTTNTASSDASGAALRNGDELDVTFVNVPPDYAGTKVSVIDENGDIYLIHNQKFHAAGKTVSQLHDDIEKLYVPAYYATLDVSILTPKRTYSVGGEVKAGGSFVYPGKIDLIQAINQAGGLTDFANHKKVQVIRAGARKPITVNFDKALTDSRDDIEIFPGDTITVLKRVF